MTFGPQVSERGLQPSRTTTQHDGDRVQRRNSLDQLMAFKSQLARRIHELNNLLTAFHCLWDGAAQQLARTPDGLLRRNELEQVVEQMQLQFQALQRDAADLGSQIESELRSVADRGGSTQLE